MANDDITEKQLLIVMLFYTSAGVAMSTLGGVGNTITIKTFISMGLTEGVTISLLVLSITDLVFIVAQMCRAVCAGFMAFEELCYFIFWFPVDPSAVHFFLGHIGYVFYTYTVMITTFLAVARCMCVLKPLSFKYLFTTRMSLLILGACLVFCVVCITPIFGYMDITTIYDKRVNATRQMLLIAPEREMVRKITWSIRDVGVAVPSQVIVVFCVVVIIKCLKAASKFRHGSALGSMTNINVVQVRQSTMVSLSDDGCVLRNSPKPVKAKTGTDKLSNKDLKVVRQVILISVVFIACNTPKIMLTIAGLHEPRMSLGGKLENIYMTMNWLTDLFQVINASSGILIYYKYNSKFRKTLCPVR